MGPEQHLPDKIADVPEKQYNRLIFEKSPYLLQHAENPVDWYPWGDEAFARAVNENKPIFLSIGYATCHWCHVMAHESFEDPGIADLLKDFICIKVDREERPDIDSIYMSVSQMMTGRGGWPLTVFLTPEKKPFFIGTYFPKESRFGMIGLADLLPRITRSWQEQRSDLVESAEKVTSALQPVREPQQGTIQDISILEKGYEELTLLFDAHYGGFGPAPKFPSPHTLLFLLRYWKRSGETRARTMVEKTLGAMRCGGVFDQVGGGFHRYSTDAQWHVPHFEKMLYDQALLIMAYTQAYQATKNPEFRNTAKDIISYVMRTLRSPEGAFFSAEDADSPEGEGAFYLWTMNEIEKVLGTDDARVASCVFGITPAGNYQGADSGGAKNILYRTKSIHELASSYGISDTDLELRLESIRDRLYRARELRIRPSLDDKVLADWNGLIIAALAQAARVFGDADYLGAARQAMQFVLTRMRGTNGELLHRFRDGEPAIKGFGDDYSFIIKGLIELYESTFEPEYLSSARELNTWFLTHFWDENQGGFFTVSDTAEVLLMRKKEIYDGAIPSCNSVSFENLVNLAHLLGDPSNEQRASELLQCFAASVYFSPSSHTWFLCALNHVIGPIHDVVIVGERDADDTRAMIMNLTGQFIPCAVIMLKQPETSDLVLSGLSPFTRPMKVIEGKTTAYICTGTACTLPITEPGQILELLGCDTSDK
jgi:uncharacterized protein